MEVELVAYTPDPERLCAMAGRGCREPSIPDLEEIDDETKEEVIDTIRETGHHGVFEHVNFTFKVEGVSRTLSHQLVRHRLATYDQQSQRVVSGDEFDYVMPERIEEAETLLSDFHEGQFDSWIEEMVGYYKEMQDAGIPNEDARFILPNATTTNLTVTMNARMLRTMFEQRCCKRAQWEIRDMAFRMLKQCKEVAPLIFKDAGAPCMGGGECPESSKFTCGDPYTDEEVRELLSGGSEEGKEMNGKQMVRNAIEQAFLDCPDHVFSTKEMIEEVKAMYGDALPLNDRSLMTYVSRELTKMSEDRDIERVDEGMYSLSTEVEGNEAGDEDDDYDINDFYEDQIQVEKGMDMNGGQ